MFKRFLEPKGIQRWTYIGVATLIFAIAFTQDPLYTSNQTTKFLQGLAQAGLGNLQEDWLANTIDPLPAFTFLVRWSYTIFGEFIFYLYQLVIFGIYVYSLTSIAAKQFRINDSVPKFLLFFMLFIAAHGIRGKLFEVKLNFMYYGLAEQYIIDHYFHPAVFGVLMPLSIYLFWTRKSIWAVVLLAIAATIHPAYLPSAAILTLSYMLVSWQRHRAWKPPLAIGALAFVGVLPVFLYMTLTFQPTTAELFQRSQDILVNIRIPHHSVPSLWLLSAGTILQLAMMTGAIYLVRRTELFWMLVLPLVSALGLTLVQLIINSDSLAFTAPWRVSAFLMPISLVILLAAFVTWIFQRWPRAVAARQRAIAIGACLVIGGIVIGNIFDQVEKFQASDSTRGMMNYVRATHQPGETYLIPDSIALYIDLEPLWKFRLYTGAPILANVKSHPYKDVEVIEWFDRIQLIEQFYRSSQANRCTTLQAIRDRYDITHVVFSARRRDPGCPGLNTTYEDKNYRVYSIAD
jgi:hypothetical protein